VVPSEIWAIFSDEDGESVIPSEIWAIFSDEGGETGVPSEIWAIFSDEDGESVIPSEIWAIFSDEGGETGVLSEIWAIFSDGHAGRVAGHGGTSGEIEKILLHLWDMTIFTPEMKMADLIEANYHLLAVLSRLGIEGGFGERNVREICEKNHLDPDTFILICSVYSNKDYVPSEDILRDGHIDDILRYLHQSHDYYTNNALVLIASSIESLIKPCTEAQRKVIWKFFSDYKAELDKHFEYEEGEVIPYVQNLLLGKRTPGFSIDRFEENHSNIEEKISDLKSLILKSMPSVCDDRLRVQLLNYIYALENDLDRHTNIEDNILVPMVRLIENPGSRPKHPLTNTVEDDERDELSDREKEILVSVAQGLLNKEIADKHNISINTVITHRKNITRKTGIKTVAGLTVYAILNNLVDINSIK